MYVLFDVNRFYPKTCADLPDNERREVPISTEVAVNAASTRMDPPAARFGAQLPEVTGRNIPGFARLILDLT